MVKQNTTITTIISFEDRIDVMTTNRSWYSVCNLAYD